MRRFLLLILFILVLSSSNVLAIREANKTPIPDRTDYITLESFENTPIPPADRFELARQLLGVTDIPDIPTNIPVRRVGDTQVFYVGNESPQLPKEINAALLAIGRHIYVWVEEGGGVSQTSAQNFATRFDEDVYEPLRDLVGSEASPGVDGEQRVYALFARRLDRGVAAYYSSQHAFPAIVSANSNEHDMMFFNLQATGTRIDSQGTISVAAHEFQHMIRQNIDSNESSWVDEGTSVFAENYLGLDNTQRFALSFLENPHTQLNDWSAVGNTVPHYGASHLFLTYFYEQYGEEGIRQFSVEPLNGLQGFDRVIRALGGTGVNELFADWVIANVVQDVSTSYGYRTLPPLPSATITEAITETSFMTTGSIQQYASDYYTFSNIADVQELQVTLSAPFSVNLLPTDAPSGLHFWYSNKADDSDTSLTRQFDLTQVDSATLEYSIWFDIEQYWDYGYVVISTDNGATWDMLSTENMTDNNPQGKAYGRGYTGKSKDWIREAISLEDYVGNEVLIRFQMITDDATTQPGMAIDDVWIQEIGYADDFEVNDGAWQSAGWLYTNNRLPQDVWVQVIQQIDGEVIVDRWLAWGGGEWTAALRANANEVFVAISPIAPLTTVPMSYELTVNTH